MDTPATAASDLKPNDNGHDAVVMSSGGSVEMRMEAADDWQGLASRVQPRRVVGIFGCLYLRSTLAACVPRLCCLVPMVGGRHDYFSGMEREC